VKPRPPCIAIDGPVAAGKSTIARLIADRLRFTYIDSGAMYRALAWKAHQRGICVNEVDRVTALLNEVQIDLKPQPGGINRVLVNDQDITHHIRTQQIGELASKLSELPEVRRKMVLLQQQMAQAGGVVMEGRDIQTIVLPNAEVKIFLTAPAEERARRRLLELQERGHTADLEAVLCEITARDERDSNREHSPLRAAPDSVHIDTWGLTIEQVVQRVLAVVKAKSEAQDKSAG